MAVSDSKQKKSRKQPDSGGDGGRPVAAKRRKHTEIRMVGGRIYDPANGKTCHQCRQKTMDFVAACKNSKNQKPCTFKFCHKCLFNRYGEKAEEMAVMEDWDCPKCRGICNCSFCMKKRGNQPTGILVHTARATGFSSVSELLNVNGSENVGVGKHMRPTKHGAGNDRIVLSPIKQDENILSEQQKKTKRGKSKKLHDGKNGDMDQEDVAILTEGNAIMTNSGGKLKGKESKVHEDNISKPKIAKKGSKDALQCEEINGILRKQTCKKVPQKEVKASETVEALEPKKKMKKGDPKAQKIGCESDKEKLTTPLEKLEKDGAHMETVVDSLKQQANYLELQNKDVIAEIELPKGFELTTVAGVGLKPEDVGHALQFLEFCAAFGKILNLKKGEPEYVLRELITGGRVRRGKVCAVNQFHIKLVTLLQEELEENSTLLDSTNGRSSWLQALKGCATQFALEELKLDQFGKGSDHYESFSSSEKLMLLNFICDELLCTEKLRSWIADQNSKHTEKVKEAKEKVLAAKQKEKHLKQKIVDDLAKAIISRKGASLSISEHDAIVSQIKAESAIAHAELLEAKGVVPDDKQRIEAVRTQPIVCDADGRIYWKLKGQSNETNILLQDVGTWDAVQPGEKWFAYTVEEEKKINEYISALSSRIAAKRSLCSKVKRKPSSKPPSTLQIQNSATIASS